VAEWFKAPVLKTGVPAKVPWVRIPPLPPLQNRTANAHFPGDGDELDAVLGAPADVKFKFEVVAEERLNEWTMTTSNGAGLLVPASIMPLEFRGGGHW
jgi:hypothetical protein